MRIKINKIVFNTLLVIFGLTAIILLIGVYANYFGFIYLYLSIVISAITLYSLIRKEISNSSNILLPIPFTTIQTKIVKKTIQNGIVYEVYYSMVYGNWKFYCVSKYDNDAIDKANDIRSIYLKYKGKIPTL